MKINFKKLEELEKHYNVSGSYICNSVLNNLVNIVTSANDSTSITNNTRYILAYETLVDLKVIEPENNTSKPQPLNS